MKKTHAKSRLLILYKFTTDLQASTGFSGDIEIGFPQKEFNNIKLESSLLGKFNNTDAQEFDDINEFKFNFPVGQLSIYNKDAHEKV